MTDTAQYLAPALRWPFTPGYIGWNCTHCGASHETTNNANARQWIGRKRTMVTWCEACYTNTTHIVHRPR